VSTSALARPLEALSSALVSWGAFAEFCGQVAWRIVTPPRFADETLRHLWITSIRCLGPVVAVNVPCGMVISLQGLEIFSLFGAHRLLSSLVSVAVLRELAPIMASVLIAAQGGSATAAELGSMRIKEELDATEVMAIDSMRLHVVPRVLALTAAGPILYTVGATAGIAGSYLTAVIMRGEAGGVFWSELWALSQPMDLWAGLLKTCVFGATIGLVAAFHGFTATGGAAGVGRAVNFTVVRSVLAFVTLNYFLTIALYGTPT
jgi:phospholipid/cholesterol/gamma-HCH transport system permease protein